MTTILSHPSQQRCVYTMNNENCLVIVFQENVGYEINLESIISVFHSQSKLIIFYHID